MPITKVSVAAAERFADGREFGEAGPYLRIHGIAQGELDPAAAENAVIVDLDKAERNAAGPGRVRDRLFHSAPDRAAARQRCPRL